jgi:hypothetical protein
MGKNPPVLRLVKRLIGLRASSLKRITSESSNPKQDFKMARAQLPFEGISLAKGILLEIYQEIQVFLGP